MRGSCRLPLPVACVAPLSLHAMKTRSSFILIHDNLDAVKEDNLDGVISYSLAISKKDNLDVVKVDEGRFHTGSCCERNSMGQHSRTILGILIHLHVVVSLSALPQCHVNAGRIHLTPISPVLKQLHVFTRFYLQQHACVARADGEAGHCTAPAESARPVLSCMAPRASRQRCAVFRAAASGGVGNGKLSTCKGKQ